MLQHPAKMKKMIQPAPIQLMIEYQQPQFLWRLQQWSTLQLILRMKKQCWLLRWRLLQWLSLLKSLWICFCFKVLFGSYFLVMCFFKVPPDAL
jgi:hypothetical protein